MNKLKNIFTFTTRIWRDMYINFDFWIFPNISIHRRANEIIFGELFKGYTSLKINWLIFEFKIQISN